MQNAYPKNRGGRAKLRRITSLPGLPLPLVLSRYGKSLTIHARGKLSRQRRMALPAPDVTPPIDRFATLRLRDMPTPPVDAPGEPGTAKALSTAQRSRSAEHESPPPNEQKRSKPVAPTRLALVLTALISAAATGGGMAVLQAHQRSPAVAKTTVVGSSSAAPSAPATNAGDTRESSVPRPQTSELEPHITPIVVPSQPAILAQHASQSVPVSVAHSAAPSHRKSAANTPISAIRERPVRRSPRVADKPARRPERPKAGASRTRPKRTNAPGPSTIQPGYLTVAATPYATVYVNGRKLGDTPLLKVRVSPGTHKLRGVAADGRTASAVVTVKSGATVRHRLHYGE